jgi:serralysin
MATSPPTYTGATSALITPTGNAVVDAIIVGSKWGTGPKGTGATLTFSFPSSLDLFDTRPDVPGNYNPDEVTKGGFAEYLKGFSAFAPDAQQSGREVLAAWAVVADLKFTEVAATTVDAGTLRFAMTAPPGLGASTYGVSSWPQDIAGAGDTWMNSAFLFPEGWAAGTQNFLTMLHEVGHAIGLKHPHDTGNSDAAGWPATPSVLDKIGDDTLVNYSTQDMVMAYNDLPGVGAPVQADFAPTTPMRVDIQAIQAIYGPNMAHNAGNTTYTFRSDQKYNQTIWDAGGIDTIVVEGSRGAGIDLNGGTWSELGLPLTYSERGEGLVAVKARPDLTSARTVFIFDTVVIENATGGSGNDFILGNAVGNRLQGGAGDDTMDGGAGIDVAVFAAARAQAVIQPAGQGIRVTTPNEGTDGLLNIERLQFADGALALDSGVNGNAGKTAQILRALLGKDALYNTLFAGIGISLFDGGMGYTDIVGLAIGTPVFEQLAGGRSNEAFVSLVYKNVIGAVPGPNELSTYVGLLDSGAFTQASLGALAAQVSFNVESTDLVALVGTGLAYDPYGG